MNIGEVGNLFASTDKIEYLSDATLIEYDFLIIDTNALFAQKGDSQRMTLYEKRRKNLKEFIDARNIPIVFFTSASPQIVVIDRMGQRISYPPTVFFPVDGFLTEAEIGKKIEINSDTIFESFLKKYRDYLQYNSFFTKYNGTVIAEIPHAKKPLAFFNLESVFLPRFNSSIRDRENEFLSDMVSVVDLIRNSGRKSALPEWANNYFLPSEESIINDVRIISLQLEDLKAQLVRKQIVLEDILRNKILFTGTGKELENQIEALLKEMGFEILESNPYRDDLVLKYEDKIAVLEIKGVSKSSAEKHAAQLEKWIAGYLEENEIKPKGILIVNAFREQPLTERTELSFPDQMLKYSISREHCLMTGTQFLCLYYTIKENPEKAKELINSMFDTNGYYEGFRNWSDYITHRDESI